MKHSKTILITGATSGIGRNAALELARVGHRVIATGRNVVALESLRAEAKGTQLTTLSLDVTDAVSIRAAADEVARITNGVGLDVLVNNAGFGILAPSLETSDAQMRSQYDTNVFGLMAVTRAFVPAMVARKQGRVINVSSVGGRITLPFFGAYNSTKYAVESLSDALRLELAPFGVQVALVEPGLIRTEFADRSMGWISEQRENTSPWNAVIARADAMKVQADRFSAKPAVVTRAIRHAIEARRARVRYVVPFATRFMVALSAWIPTRVLDWMLTVPMGLTRRGLSVPAARTLEAAAGAAP